MFDILGDVPLEIAVEAAHEAADSLLYRKPFPAITNGSRPEVHRVLLGIQAEIEQAEGTALSGITQDRAESYVPKLSGAVRDLAKEKLGLNPDRGRRLLEELRKISVHGHSKPAPGRKWKGSEMLESVVNRLNQENPAGTRIGVARAIAIQPAYPASASIESKRLNIDMPKRVFDDLVKLSKKSGRSMTDLVRLALALVKIAFDEAGEGNKLLVTALEGEPIREILIPQSPPNKTDRGRTS